MRRFFLPVFACVACVSLFASGASAQTTWTTGDGYGVSFDDDDLLAPGPSAYGTVIHPPHRGARALLIRPRTNFVPELLVSVSTL